MYRIPKGRWNIIKVFLAIIPFAINSVFALQEDRKEKIYITADSTIYNYKLGSTIFEGHVKVDQGSTHITADRLTTKTNPQHKMTEAIAYGINELAHCWTLPKKGDLEIHAQAKIIKFYPTKSNISLEQKVIMTQGENSFQGELILYNRNDQTVFVPASNKGKAVLVYNPDSRNGSS
jgi:lipopolysaccharide export system protein LptA